MAYHVHVESTAQLLASPANGKGGTSVSGVAGACTTAAASAGAVVWGGWQQHLAGASTFTGMCTSVAVVTWGRRSWVGGGGGCRRGRSQGQWQLHLLGTHMELAVHGNGCVWEGLHTEMIARHNGEAAPMDACWMRQTDEGHTPRLGIF